MTQTKTILDATRPKVQFLNEWTPDQLTQMERAITKHFKNRETACRNGKGYNYYIFKTYDGINEVLGLAYTSSSSKAAYWVCNTEAENNKYPGYHYIGFALSTDLIPYAILWDKDENEITIPL